MSLSLENGLPWRGLHYDSVRSDILLSIELVEFWRSCEVCELLMYIRLQCCICAVGFFPASTEVSLRTPLSTTESEDKKLPCKLFLTTEAGRGCL